ncbi:MAG: metal-dependent transcriptional regulator [Anaerolineae bacterium]
MISPTVEEYLETIHRLEQTVEGTVVPLSDLANSLGISVVSANQMVRRLEERELVTYTPYRGVVLSAEGRERAATLLRRHRLWERFLTDVLGLPWEEVHEEACRLEHATSSAVEGRLADFLGEPATCPHGHPVPTEKGEVARQESSFLAQAEPGQAVRVLSVPEQNPELLCYLAGMGFRPGVEVQVEAKAPFGGVLTVRIGEERHVLASEVAAQVRVQTIHSPERG